MFGTYISKILIDLFFNNILFVWIFFESEKEYLSTSFIWKIKNDTHVNFTLKNE